MGHREHGHAAVGYVTYNWEPGLFVFVLHIGIAYVKRSRRRKREAQRKVPKGSCEGSVFMSNFESDTRALVTFSRSPSILYVRLLHNFGGILVPVSTGYTYHLLLITSPCVFNQNARCLRVNE
jgi:hypothetical protein